MSGINFLCTTIQLQYISIMKIKYKKYPKLVLYTNYLSIRKIGFHMNFEYTSVYEFFYENRCLVEYYPQGYGQFDISRLSKGKV